MVHEFTCSVCGEHKIHESNFSIGYGRDKDNNIVCYECCGKQDATTLEQLQPKGKFVMYLNINDQTLSNWPGTFQIKLNSIRKGRHNIAKTRYDTWFDYKGNNYHAVQYGDNTQIAHIRRLKSN